MPTFTYRAYEVSGSKVEDRIEASDEREALRRLASRGLTVTSIRAERHMPKQRARTQPSEEVRVGIFQPRLKGEDTVVLCRELAILIEAGVPIAEALESMLEGARHPVIRTSVESVIRQVRNGVSLSDSLRSAPKVFPPLLADIVAVAEEGGTLPTALDMAASQLEDSLEFRRRLRAALTYPVLLLGIAVATALVLVTFVLPRFTKIFANMGVPIPPATQLLLTLSAQSQAGWPYFLVAAVLAYFALKALLKNPAFRTAWTRLLLRIPIAGPLLTKVAMARALSACGSLITCNVPLLKALSHAGRVSGNPVHEQAFRTVATRVETGATLAEALREAESVPSLVVQMASVGERTGRLGPLLLRTAAFFAADVDSRLRSLSSIIEPVLIVGLGAFIGFITISVITPIYSIVGQVR